MVEKDYTFIQLLLPLFGANVVATSAEATLSYYQRYGYTTQNKDHNDIEEQVIQEHKDKFKGFNDDDDYKNLRLSRINSKYTIKSEQEKSSFLISSIDYFITMKGFSVILNVLKQSIQQNHPSIELKFVNVILRPLMELKAVLTSDGKLNSFFLSFFQSINPFTHSFVITYTNSMERLSY